LRWSITLLSDPIAQALSLAQAYENETDFTVWSDLTENLNNVLSVKLSSLFSILTLKFEFKVSCRMLYG
jgi:hypothetical protein